MLLSRLRALLSDSAIYGASSLIERIAGFLLLPLYTRYLGPEEYGIIAMLAIVSAVFPALARLGMTNAIFRRFNLVKDETERRLVLSTGMISVLWSSALFCGIGLMAVVPLTNLLLPDAELAYLVQLSLLSAALSTVGEAPMTALRASRRVKMIAGLNLFRLVISIGATIWLVVVREQGVYGFVLTLLIASVVVDLVGFWTTRHSFAPLFDRQVCKGMLRYGLPFVPHHIQAVGLVYFGQFVVAEMLSLEEAGRYNVALRFVLPLSFVIMSLQKAWVPYKFEVHAKDERPQDFFRSAVTYYCAAISCFLVFIAVWGPELLRLMTTERFHAAATLVPIMALIPAAHGLYFMLGTGIELTNDTRHMPLASLAGLLTVVLLSLTLVPWFGASGAVIATISGWLTMAVVIYYLSQRQFPVKYDLHLLAGLLAVAFILVLGTIALQQSQLLIRVGFAVAASVTYPAFVVSLLLCSKGEGPRIRAFLPRLIFWQSS